MNKKYANIPAVHKKVRKKDMVFEYILIGVLIIFLVYIFVDANNFFPQLTSNVKITSIAGAVVALYALICNLIQL